MLIWYVFLSIYSISLCSTQVCPHLGLSGQHVVPEDGCPTAGQLTDIGDDDNRQRHGL